MNLYSDKEIEQHIRECGLQEGEYVIIDNLSSCDEALLDYEKRIFVRNISPNRHASNINIRLMLDYLRFQGHDVESFLNSYGRKLGAVLDDFYQWVPLDYHIKFLDNFQEFLGVKNPRKFEGYGVVANEQERRATAFSGLMSGFFSLRTVFESVPFFNRGYDNDLTFQYIESRQEGSRLTVTLLFRCFDNFKESILFRTQFWSLGLLTALPRKRGYKRALGKVLYYGYSLLRLLTGDYAYMGLDVEERADGIYIGGVRYAKRAFLKKRRVNFSYSRVHRLQRFLRGMASSSKRVGYKDIFLPLLYEEGRRPAAGEGGDCYLVIKDLFDDEGMPVIRAGELFDLPYSCFEVVIDLRSYDRSYRKGLKRGIRTLDIHLARMRAQLFELEQANRLAAEKATEAEEAGRTLVELKSSLESRIVQRTRALEESNRSLCRTNEQQKRVIAELRAAKEEVERVNQEQTNSFINFAHEARTPLTLIANYLEDYIKRRKAAAEDRELMIIKRNIDKLERDMLNFLDCEKLLRGDLGFNSPSVVDLSKLLRNSLTLFRESALRSGIRIEDWIGEGIFTVADENALDRMINNLLDNALKYTERRGTVKVGLRVEDERIIFTVEDNGSGIAKDRLDTIFRPYHRINSKKSSRQGMGMGLTIVKKVVELLEGEIRVESEEGRGTLFVVELGAYFPQASELEGVKESALNAAKVLDRTLPILNDKERAEERGLPLIMVVENSLDIVQYYRERFKGLYRVKYALSAEEGLEMLDIRLKPQVILLDLMMDEMDGYDFLKDLNRMPEFNDIPVICITARAESEEKIKVLRAGALDFMAKPFRADELVARIDSLLRHRENRSTADQAVIFQQNCDRFDLSPKEREIAALLIKGKESKEIALILGKALSTVNNQLYNMFEKTGVRTRGELIVILKSQYFGG